VAQTKKKRRRKHRGTQGGKIDTRPRARPRTRAEAKQRAKARRGGGGRKRTAAQRPGPGAAQPTWASAFRKSLVAGALFLVLLAVIFKRPLGASAALAGFMLVFYIPMAYYTDRYMYMRRLRKDEQERIARSGGADS
jgi:hypothetical protein